MIIKTTAASERERVAADPGSCMHAAAFDSAYFDFHWHHHPEAELTLIERGRGIRAVGSTVESYGPGDVVLIGPDVPHSWSSRPDVAGGVRSVVIQFPARLIADLPESRRLADLLRQAQVGLAGPPTIAPRIVAILATQDPLERLGHLLEVLAAAAWWRPLTCTPPRARRRDPRLDRAVEWLHQHAREPIELRALAARVEMLPPALSRSFRRAYGIGPGEYLARLRIGMCCSDLVAGDGEVGAIAFASGFGNLASFHRWFRRVTGSTPERWRIAARQ